MSAAREATDWTIAGAGAIAAPVIGTVQYRSGDVAWQPTDLEGFWLKPLYEDADRGEKTMLMKVDAGAFAPEHTHPGEFEQVYVISGSFYDQHGTMRAGDYCCRSPDALHSSGSVDGAIVMLVYTKR